MSDHIADVSKKVQFKPIYEVNVHEPTSGGRLYRIVEHGERKQIIGKFFNKEKAEKFVRAINSHEALLDAARCFLETAPSDEYAIGYQECRQALAKVIAQAEGKQS